MRIVFSVFPTFYESIFLGKYLIETPDSVAPAKARVQVVMYASMIYVYAEWRRSRLLQKAAIQLVVNEYTAVSF